MKKILLVILVLFFVSGCSGSKTSVTTCTQAQDSFAVATTITAEDDVVTELVVAVSWSFEALDMTTDEDKDAVVDYLQSAYESEYDTEGTGLTIVTSRDEDNATVTITVPVASMDQETLESLGFDYTDAETEYISLEAIVSEMETVGYTCSIN